jgi:hypothetical protein
MEKIQFSSFLDWNARQYLNNYYGQPVSGDPTVQFVVEQARRIPSRNAVAIEIGTGPVIADFAALARHVAEIHVADYLSSNLAYLQNWVEGKDQTHDWSQYLGFVLQYAGNPRPTADDIATLEALVRAKVKQYLFCDVMRTNPLGTQFRQNYDCVLSVSCADSITNDIVQWRAYMQHIFSLLKPGGFFIGSSLKECVQYGVGEEIYPAVYLREDDCHQLMLEYGFDPQSIVVKSAPEGYQLDEHGQRIEPLRPEYSEVILTSGFLKQ